MYINVCMHIHLGTYICIHVYTHMYVHCVYMYVHTWLHNVYIYVHTYMYSIYMYVNIHTVYAMQVRLICSHTVPSVKYSKHKRQTNGCKTSVTNETVTHYTPVSFEVSAQELKKSFVEEQEQK